MPFTQPWFDVDFGSAYAAIGTTGYRLYKNDGTDSVARTTSGVVDLGNGGYGVPDVSVPDDAAGIEWDTGGGSPVYAREDIEPYRDRDLGNYDNAVYVSWDHGTAGTSNHLGTRKHPVKDIADAKTIATAKGVRSYVFLDDHTYTLPSTHTDWHFTSEGITGINVNGQTVTGSVFDSVALVGAISASDAVFKTVTFINATGLTGSFVECCFIGSHSVSGTARFYDCMLNEECTFDLSAMTYLLFGFGGRATFTNMDSGVVDVSERASGRLTVAASCTGGTINALGNFNRADGEGGVSIVRMTADALLDETLVGHDVADSLSAEIKTHATPTEVKTQADQALVDYDPPTKTELDTAETNIIAEIDANEVKIDSIITDLAAIPAEVWDRAFASHTTDTTMGWVLSKLIRSLVLGRKKQDQNTKQFITYDADNSSVEISKHNTTDAAGDPANIRIFEMDPV
jgi:hypothetical protein